MSPRYSSVPQVRGSLSISITRVVHFAGAPGWTGLRGMRVPSIDSTIRPSASASTRAVPTNSRKNGTPTISTARPIESEAPVMTKVKYRMPVASDSSMYARLR
jgi:hypothetical protein